MDDSENQLQNDPESPVIDTLTVGANFHSFIRVLLNSRMRSIASKRRISVNFM